MNLSLLNENLFKAPLCVHLIITNEKQELLLILRKNTGIFDNLWGFPSGKVEINEFPSQAAAREAREELNIEVTRQDLTSLVVVKSNFNLNTESSTWYDTSFFFEVLSYHGEISNLEPEKHEKVGFFPMNSLPDNLVPITQAGLRNYREKRMFSEFQHDYKVF